MVGVKGGGSAALKRQPTLRGAISTTVNLIIEAAKVMHMGHYIKMPPKPNNRKTFIIHKNCFMTIRYVPKKM